MVLQILDIFEWMLIGDCQPWRSSCQRSEEGDRIFADQLLKTLRSLSPWKCCQCYSFSWFFYAETNVEIHKKIELTRPFSSFRNPPSSLSLYLSFFSAIPFSILRQKFHFQRKEDFSRITWSVALSAQQPSTRKVQKPSKHNLDTVFSKTSSI